MPVLKNVKNTVVKEQEKDSNSQKDNICNKRPFQGRLFVNNKIKPFQNIELKSVETSHFNALFRLFIVF